MNYGGDAAETVVRMSLESFEVAARITGTGAKNLAVLLAAALKEEQKTKGKARLTSMIKSGKALTVFSIPEKDLKKFTQEAKKYGVLYTVIKDKNAKGNDVIDIITRTEDAPKINRIVERFKLATYDKAKIVSEVTKGVPKCAEDRKESLSKLGSDKTGQKESVKEKLDGYREAIANNTIISDLKDRAKER